MERQVVMLRTSERKTYRRCRWQWEQIYINLLSPQRQRTALSFGTLIHKALEAWYIPGRKRGEHPAEAFDRLFNAEPVERDVWDEEGNRIDPLVLGKTMLTGYVEKYGLEKHIEILQSEMTFEIDVFDKRGEYLCTYVGKIDAPYIDHVRKRKRIFEHKSAKTIEEVFLMSAYGEQGKSYWWASMLWLRHIGILDSNEVCDAVIYNFLRKGIPDERPHNAQGHALNKPSKDALVAACEARELPAKGTVTALSERLLAVGVNVPLLGEPSARQPKPLFERQELPLTEHELDEMQRRIRMEAWEMAQVRAGKLPIYKNPTKDCRWDCPVKDACELHEVGADFEGLFELQFEPWDPYSDHELDEEKGR